MKVAGLLCKGPFIYDVIIYVTFMQLEGSEKDAFLITFTDIVVSIGSAKD